MSIENILKLFSNVILSKMRKSCQLFSIDKHIKKGYNKLNEMCEKISASVIKNGVVVLVRK